MFNFCFVVGCWIGASGWIAWCYKVVYIFIHECWLCTVYIWMIIVLMLSISFPLRDFYYMILENFLLTYFRGCLDSFFLSLNFYHSSLIIHYSSLNFSYPFGIITQFPSLNIFHTICGPIPINRYNFFFFLVAKLTEANIKKIKNKKIKTQN